MFNSVCRLDDPRAVRESRYQTNPNLYWLTHCLIPYLPFEPVAIVSASWTEKEPNKKKKKLKIMEPEFPFYTFRTEQMKRKKEEIQSLQDKKETQNPKKQKRPV